MNHKNGIIMHDQSTMSNRFLYREIAHRICEDFQGAAKLPSERSLAEHYDCTRTTIRTALKLLQGENLLDRQPNRNKRSLVLPENDAADSAEPWTPVVALFGQEHLKDPNYMDFVAGCLERAREEKLLFTMQTIPAELGPVGSLAELHPHAKPAGYLVAGDVEDDVLMLLHRSGCPCIFMGNRLKKTRLTEIRQERHHFFECYLPEEDKYETVLRKFLSLGHSRILAVNFGRYENMVKRLYREYDKPFADFGFAEIPWSIQGALKPLQEKSAEIAEMARDYTAMLVPFGNVISFDIYMALVNAGIRIPEDLSLVYASGKPEWFVPHFKISTVFSSAWDEGANCVKELARQIRNGEPVGGVHYTEYRFMDNGTVVPPENRSTKHQKP
jgi:DNA-binding LacI/PurR family transcriptional regulator